MSNQIKLNYCKFDNICRNRLRDWHVLFDTICAQCIGVAGKKSANESSGCASTASVNVKRLEMRCMQLSVSTRESNSMYREREMEHYNLTLRYCASTHLLQYSN